MSEGPSRAEMDRLYQTIDDGFKGTHSRLDLLNGRTLKGEQADADLRARVIGLEKEVFTRPRRRRHDGDEGTEVDKPRPLLTKRESALIGVGVMILAALVKLALFVGELGFETLKAVVKHG
jgi:hypothetical protein